VSGYEFSDGPASGDADDFSAFANFVTGLSGLPPEQRIELLARLQSLTRRLQPDTAIEGPLLDLLVDLRATLRQQKQFELADSLRDALSALGVEIGDTPQGSTWTRR
jgi:cysteinyl-tRNA synthetase